ASGKEVYERFGNFSLTDCWFEAVDPLAAEDQTSSEIHNSSLPFDKQARQYTHQEAQDVKFFKENYFNKDPWRQISDDWLSFATELALKLDRDTNNTSLALAIELVESGKVFLFPGDAQVGNWESWQDRTWQVDGSPKKADTEPL